MTSFVQDCNRYRQKYLIVKGQTICCLYPQPELRQPGDIDFLVSKITNISQIFPNAEIPSKLKEKEYGYEHNGITYELHTRLIDFGCKKHRILWEDQISKEWLENYCVNIGGVEVCTLSPTLNVVYLFVHLFFHFIREGISMRQLCDWAIVLNHYHNEIDRKQIASLLKSLDMIKAYKAFGVILVDELGLSKDVFPVDLDDNDRKWKYDILNKIFKGGNFGILNHKDKATLGFKFETFKMTASNCIKFYRLAPSELMMMIPKMVYINSKLLL